MKFYIPFKFEGLSTYPTNFKENKTGGNLKVLQARTHIEACIWFCIELHANKVSVNLDASAKTWALLQWRDKRQLPCDWNCWTFLVDNCLMFVQLITALCWINCLVCRKRFVSDNIFPNPLNWSPALDAVCSDSLRFPNDCLRFTLLQLFHFSSLGSLSLLF